MPYKLKNGIYTVRCRYPGCPFNHQMSIDQNIMGMTEKDVETEAKKLAHDMAVTKHDAVYGTRHALRNPEIRKISGIYELIGATGLPDGRAQDTYYREYSKGEIILREGDAATTVCEVLRGSAFPERNQRHRYGAGQCFGAAALLAKRNRTCNVIAGVDRTKVAFYNLIEVSKRDPKKAAELFQAVMEDTFRVIEDLEHSISRTRQEIVREAVRG
jgi:hypothetical protein